MADQPTHAGVAVQAADTGRILLQQRALDPTDAPDVQGTWEFPGGGIEDSEQPEDAAWREFGEETGLPKPDGEQVGRWRSGPYVGHHYMVPVEADAFPAVNPDKQAAAAVNPDDPKRTNPDVTAWFIPEQARHLGPALRPEVASMDWSIFDQTSDGDAEEADRLHALFRGLTLAEGIPGRGNEARLKAWWIGQSGIHWGTSGDYDQCVAKATDIFGRHGVAIDPKAWCAQIHHEATGAWPGHAPGESHEAAAEEAPMDDLQLVESVTITEAAAREAKSTGRFLMQFISPGWGSSGYYSPGTLKEAARERVIPAGTHMYADHPTDAENKARPERSIKDLMAVTLEDARLGEGGALVGQVQVTPAWREFVEAVHKHIGVSIRGDAKNITEGTAEGRRGRIVEGLAHVKSVDFVTRAGRGGKVLSLLESAVSAGADIREDLSLAVLEAKYTAEQLRQMLKDGHAIRNPDGDPSYPIADKADLEDAIHAVGRGGADHDRIRAHIVKRAKSLNATDMLPATWQASGTTEAATAATTTHVPAARPGAIKKGATMPKIEIEESEHTRLTETAGRAATLEAEKSTWEAERTTLRADLSKTQGELTEAKAALLPNKDLRDQLANVLRENATLRAREVAVPLISEALDDALIGEATKQRISGELLEGIALSEDTEGRKVLDTAKLTESINDKVRVAEREAQEYREAMGIGKPRGLGQTTSGGGLLVEQKLGEYATTTAGALTKAFGLSEATAKTAAQGR